MTKIERDFEDQTASEIIIQSNSLSLPLNHKISTSQKRKKSSQKPSTSLFPSK